MRMRPVLVPVVLSVLSVLALPGAAGAAAPVPLADLQAVTAPSSPVPGHYAATTKPAASRWSVVGLRSALTGNDNLTVGGVTSNSYGPLADFVAVDNGCQRTPVTLPVTVNHVSGTGNYAVELAQGDDRLTVDPLPLGGATPHRATIFGPGIATPDHFIGIRTVHLNANKPVEITASHIGGAYGEVFVLSPYASASCLTGRQQAVASGLVNFGGSNTISLFPTLAGEYAVVQVTYGAQQSGSSSLQVSQAR